MNHQHIFVIGGGKSVILHPFEPTSSLFPALDSVKLEGRLGLNSDSRTVSGLRDSLYTCADKALRRFLLGKGYYIRFGVSALLFLAVFMLFSIVVRDPVPFIDEFLLASLAAVVFFLYSERRVLASETFHGMATRSRQLIDTAFFSESRIVSIIETWREEFILLGPAVFYKSSVEGEQYELMDDDVMEAEALCAAFARRWQKQGLVADLYEILKKNEPAGKVMDRIVKKLGIEEASLVLSYMRLLQALARRKIAL